MKHREEQEATGAASRQDAASARVLSIDILRGLALLWVITFHLWADMTHHLVRADLIIDVRDECFDGRFLAAIGAAGEALLSQGNLGVALFMMLSGLSLTMNAYQRGEPGVLRGYATRFRRILPPYWFGILLLVATVAVIALLQVLLDGGSFAQQWSNVRLAAVEPVQVGWQDVLWALSAVGWVFRDRPDANAAGTVVTFSAPVNALWFIELLLQYYLLFPLALRLERRAGPWKFALGAILVTATMRTLLVVWITDALDPIYATRFLWALAPFRMPEFLIGMSLGHLLATHRDEVAGWTGRAADLAGMVVLGLALVVTGLLFAPDNDAQLIAGDLLVQVGLVLIVLPLLFKAPGRLETSAPARALVFVGVVSFTSLIANDVIRYVASFLRYEGYADGPAWWFFLVAIYVPASALLAYPLASMFGLLPKQRAIARAGGTPRRAPNRNRAGPVARVHVARARGGAARRVR